MAANNTMADDHDAGSDRQAHCGWDLRTESNACCNEFVGAVDPADMNAFEQGVQRQTGILQVYANHVRSFHALLHHRT